MTHRQRAVFRICLLLYPLGAGAMAVNVFFASLLGAWVGLPVISTEVSILVGCLIGIPATWAFSHHIQNLIEKAEGKSQD